ncbi:MULTISPECIES: phosphatase PAP2 family protein [Chromohalobacter]|nr:MULTISPECIES: phosphatase PAP2 family protein [Chromohalobacter]MBZ5877606.1 phosphatase PAP2 family protein [Chromohalobacter salexigens]MDF9435166.1 phosphatase PAP2 family protein [Chromohalobacter israelensis]MDO0946841.1 phosphatase PAP2 family protein [Chromohalobacter salexigens]NQY44224.1 phosphatase PAP2 family protein [Chromohalobacter sp.]NWO57447.1 phosphatase PAP2 family protein [Chromohalobacter salexigens]
MRSRPLAMFDRLDTLEWQLCHRIALLSHRRLVHGVFRFCSRVGDWPAWVALALLQPLVHGQAGWRLTLIWGLCAATGATVYRLLKTRLCRERPYITFSSIPCTMPPLDRYSFPSGHTLHAVMFCTLTAASSPWLLVVVLPLSGLIAASRVILGLHYVSDVAAGAVLGFAIAQAGLWIAMRGQWLPLAA